MSSRMAFLGAFFSVDPAYAGMILKLSYSGGLSSSGPRVCGDDPTRVVSYYINPLWTPRMRG